jgi:hypothetical protein
MTQQAKLTTKDLIFCQEITRIKCKTNTLQEEIEKVCGFDYIRAHEKKFLCKRYNNLCKLRRDTLAFFQANRIPISLSWTGEPETIEELFRVHYNKDPSEASDKQFTACYEYYLVNDFPNPIPDGLQWYVRRFQEDFYEELNLMLEDIKIEQERKKHPRRSNRLLKNSKIACSICPK